MPNQIFKELRTYLDGSDPFMTGGHRIVKPRSDDKKNIPEWALDDARVRNIVQRSFPKYATNNRHRKGAARWIRVIHLYFRMNMTRGQVAQELGVKSSVIRGILRHIALVSKGMQANGQSRTRPRGRPKNSVPTQASLGLHEKSNLLRSRTLLSYRTNR